MLNAIGNRLGVTYTLKLAYYASVQPSSVAAVFIHKCYEWTEKNILYVF